MRVRRCTPRPPDDLFEIGLHHLDNAIDDLVATRLTLAPVVRAWSPPTGALHLALGDDPEALRGSRHIREIEERLRELLGPDREGHLDEFRTELRAYEVRCAEVGWLLGVETVVRRPVEA
jgi:hypothetical protein